ncbi:MAG: glycosyltransferase 87 family protein [Candidatus Helarchaeota archaeon]
MGSEKIHRWVNYVLLISIPAVIIITILFGAEFSYDNDYVLYQQDWTALLQGQNPYHYLNADLQETMCYYPLGFLAFAGLYVFYGLLPKIFFTCIWIVIAFVINKICYKFEITDKSTILYSLCFIMLNPFYWISGLMLGRYDIVVGLCVLLAVYAIDNAEQIKSGIYAAQAFLLKYVGLILLFPLVFVKKKINWRIGLLAIGISGAVYLFGFFLWGIVIFDPFIVHLTRDPGGQSIFTFIYDVFGIDLSKYLIYLLIIGVFIVACFLYFQNDDISTYSLILIICFILILPVFYPQYILWFFPLLSYWSIRHNYAFKRTIIMYMGIIGLVWIGTFYKIGYPPILSIFSVIINGIFILLIYFENKKHKATSEILRM